ncbi:MAG: peptidoglycan-associated lipoprotein Pal [Nitrospiria bacterium]
MVSAQGVFSIAGISLLIIMGLIGCEKKTNTASQGLDASSGQTKEVPHATENAPSSNQNVVNENSSNQIPAKTEPVELGKALKDVYFDFNTPVIRPDMKNVLDIDATLVKTKNNVKVKIEGYCDERGTDEYNLALGNKRAYSVKQFLIAEGVDRRRISTISYGKEKPVCNEHNEDCYKLNRRAHFNVQ